MWLVLLRCSCGEGNVPIRAFLDELEARRFVEQVNDWYLCRKMSRPLEHHPDVAEALKQLRAAVDSVISVRVVRIP